MGKIKNKISTFMNGRNGVDVIYYVLMGMSVFFLIMYFVFNGAFKVIMAILLLVCVVYAYFRFFSKNVSKRHREAKKFKTFFKIRYNKIKYRKVYYYKKCDNCKKILRFKRIKGEHNATCPNCSHQFKIKIK